MRIRARCGVFRTAQLHALVNARLRSHALSVITCAMPFTPVTPSDVARCATRFVQHGRAAFLIVRGADGTLFAVDGLCSHAMLPLAGARLRRGHVICPHHGARFDINNGAAKGPPASCGIRIWAVRENDGMIELDIDA